jgi:tRNA uridine 5-carboxymethylaminomethyl modification enzyme
MYTYPKKYDIIVIGAGHAGCETALASARMGCSVLLLTMNLDTIAQMSCNPAIGGLAKGQIVREIDALGGEMGKITDLAGIQFRMLNMSKGPAVQSPRAQCDRKFYQQSMKSVIEKEPNIDLKQAEAVKITVSDSSVTGVLTATGIKFESRAVIITTGTFLKGLVHVGLTHYPSGRMNEFPSNSLSDSIRELGFEVGRLKTGTPPRINSGTIDYSKLTPQHGDLPPVPFSHFTQNLTQKQVPCWVTYTNEQTHKLIKDNLDRSPLYTGVIKSIGPRYCPSIEDKVVRFGDKDRHQVFLEPEGYNTEEVYCNGISTSLPEDVQEQIVHSIDGCDHAVILRYGYAIEYDFCQPTQLNPSLETKIVNNLYFAGQINGTTGYEEAAAQGLMAGINAVLKLRSESPFILGRDEAYIGVLVDDLVTKGIMDPYRMFTSRAEYRLVLRSDNADLRLLDYGYKYGLINKTLFSKFTKYRGYITELIAKLESTVLSGDTGSLALLIKQGKTVSELKTEYHDVYPVIQPEDILPWSMAKVESEAGIEIKYAGYIKRQQMEIERFKRLETKKIPGSIDYSKIPGLLTESRQKLAKIRPVSIGQASRISGVTPSDISILLVYLK